mmetsp:Transcript_3588/g.10562  ORF Transcript_3588/g.10562 Transcript_3588/m.10562 type:complete len:382 (-) Transcript_3588:302-1447(-)
MPGRRVTANDIVYTFFLFDSDVQRDLFRDSDLDAAISQSLDEAASSPQKATSKTFLDTLKRAASAVCEEDINRQQCCPVCDEALNLSEVVIRLACKHVFHESCITPWLTNHNTCPICRSELPCETDDGDVKKQLDSSRRAFHMVQGQGNGMTEHLEDRPPTPVMEAAGIQSRSVTAPSPRPARTREPNDTSPLPTTSASASPAASVPVIPEEDSSNPESCAPATVVDCPVEGNDEDHHEVAESESTCTSRCESSLSNAPLGLSVVYDSLATCVDNATSCGGCDAGVGAGCDVQPCVDRGGGEPLEQDPLEETAGCDVQEPIAACPCGGGSSPLRAQAQAQAEDEDLDALMEELADLNQTRAPSIPQSSETVECCPVAVCSH